MIGRQPTWLHNFRRDGGDNNDHRGKIKADDNSYSMPKRCTLEADCREERA